MQKASPGDRGRRHLQPAAGFGLRPTHLPRVEVQPGGRYATRDSFDVKTLLGSCVAACLYDESSRVTGLNHFLLAAPRYSKAMPLSVTEAGRYGIHAMELLINDMMKLGASRKRLRAKIFGGAHVLGFGADRFVCVNEVNQRFILEFLGTEGIEIVSQDLGGEQGRVIHFHTDTFKVYRRFIQKTALHDLAEQEHRYWQVEVEKPEKREGEIILF